MKKSLLIGLALLISNVAFATSAVIQTGICSLVLGHRRCSVDVSISSETLAQATLDGVISSEQARELLSTAEAAKEAAKENNQENNQ